MTTTEPNTPMTKAASTAFVASTASVAVSAVLADGVRVWNDSHVEAHAEIGADTLVGRGVTVGTGVRIGARCKVQNAALVYGPAVVGDGVFIGPAAVLTNDHSPRAVNPDGSVKSGSDWERSPIVIEHGASVGAGAVIVAPARVGRWALVAAGAVVTHDVADHALVAGVPARRIGWVGRAGVRLVATDDDHLTCPDTGDRFRIVADGDQIEEIR
jgi:UDP-2-acetamido-3-amino-2,3-dideoxy-glucuronate N-acetyltransferase